MESYVLYRANLRKTFGNDCFVEVLLPVPFADATSCFIRCDAEEKIVRRALREP